MFAHVTQGSNNLSESVVFYDALLTPLGISRANNTNPAEITDEIVCYLHPENDGSRLFVVTPFDDKRATSGNGSMIAFRAASREQIDESYHNGISCGGTDEGPPGDRPLYAEGYYGAYLRDPDGNKIHVVYRGDLA